jgi:hypothetical protein
MQGWFVASGLIPETPVPLAGEPLTVVLWPARRIGSGSADEISSEPLERSAVA